MTFRRLRVLAAAAACATLFTATVTGCAPEPTPTPTPTAAFASDEEAFAAAEETYRAYVDALNAVDLSDPDTFEPVYEWTTDEANASERKSLSGLHADGLIVVGSTRIAAFLPGPADGASAEARTVAIVCSDVSEIDVLNADGETVVPPERPNVYTLQVQFVDSPSSPTGLAISESSALESDQCS